MIVQKNEMSVLSWIELVHSINFNFVNEVLEEYLHNIVIQFALQKYGDKRILFRIKAAYMISIVALSYK